MMEKELIPLKWIVFAGKGRVKKETDLLTVEQIDFLKRWYKGGLSLNALVRFTGLCYVTIQGIVVEYPQQPFYPDDDSDFWLKAT